ncbi:MAG: tol-pal system-associated acyl-CoA thioesterase [Pseudomonadota bacterium]|nr:tol-pal system-associated acyl-CoA thioesterase [Pseudomonadota bacterium]
MASLFTWPVRVYYEDTDAGGIVYYANYLKFFERARTEWLRAADIGQQVMIDEYGAGFVVRSVHIDYHAAARLDDHITLTLDISKLGRASVVFHQQALRGEQLLASAQVKVGCVDLATLRPRAIPHPAAAKMRAT